MENNIGIFRVIYPTQSKGDLFGCWTVERVVNVPDAGIHLLDPIVDLRESLDFLDVALIGIQMVIGHYFLKTGLASVILEV